MVVFKYAFAKARLSKITYTTISNNTKKTFQLWMFKFGLIF